MVVVVMVVVVVVVVVVMMMMTGDRTGIPLCCEKPRHIVVLSQSAHASREYLSTLELLSCPANTNLIAFNEETDLPHRESLRNFTSGQNIHKGGDAMPHQKKYSSDSAAIVPCQQQKCHAPPSPLPEIHASGSRCHQLVRKDLPCTSSAAGRAARECPRSLPSAHR